MPRCKKEGMYKLSICRFHVSSSRVYFLHHKKTSQHRWRNCAPTPENKSTSMTCDSWRSQIRTGCMGPKTWRKHNVHNNINFCEGSTWVSLHRQSKTLASCYNHTTLHRWHTCKEKKSSIITYHAAKTYLCKNSDRVVPERVRRKPILQRGNALHEFWCFISHSLKSLTGSPLCC